MPITLELESLFSDELAETVTYKACGEDEVSVSAIVERGNYEKEQGGSETDLAKGLSLMVQVSDLSAEPSPKPNADVVTIDGVEWEVDSFQPVGGAEMIYKIRVIRAELLSVEV